MELLKSEIQPLVEAALESLGVDASLVERMLQPARETTKATFLCPASRLPRPSAWRPSPLQSRSKRP